jgi:hypothetical protein
LQLQDFVVRKLSKDRDLDQRCYAGFTPRPISCSRIAHHLLMFSLAGILAFEIGVIRLDVKREDFVRVARSIYGTASLPGRSSWSGFAGGLRREGLGLLLRRHVLLGKDGGLCGRRSAVDRADDKHHSLAAGALRRCRILGVFLVRSGAG